MLDVRLFRTEPQLVTDSLLRRGIHKEQIDEIVALDAQVRELSSSRDELRSRVRALSNEVGQLFRSGDKEAAEDLQSESRALGAQEKDLDLQAEELSAKLRDALLHMPNMPSEDAPDGASEHDNVVVRTEGFDPESYAPHRQRVPHWDIGTEHGILDVERGVKLSGSMFVMYRGAGARSFGRCASLHWIAMRISTRRFGHRQWFEPRQWFPPATCRSSLTMPTISNTTISGRFRPLRFRLLRSHETRSWMSRACRCVLWLIAHVSAVRPGLRAKDAGELRVHEFDKVELFAYSTESQAQQLHAEVLARAEQLIADLGLAYRVLDLCAGDIGASARRTFDIEVYAPGVERWLEVSSVSWFGDYQARRANARYRHRDGKGTGICHTVNGSALAVPRVWAALVETNRQADGSIAIPELLQPYMRGLKSIGGQLGV